VQRVPILFSSIFTNIRKVKGGTLKPIAISQILPQEIQVGTTQISIDIEIQWNFIE
jgi:hypothetical protein